MLRKIFFFTFILSISWVACGPEKNSKTGQVLDTPTTGTLRVMVDEGYKPVIESCIDVFDSIYRQAKIEPTYCSEGEAVNAILKDSIQVIVISRKLDENELKFFRQRGFTPPMTPIAYDAIAFLVHPANLDTVFTTDQIQQILTGKITTWNQVNPKSNLGKLNVVFDNPLSGTLRYTKDSILLGQTLTPNASALTTNEEVLNYVKKNKNALGIISANWISDTDDSGVQQFMREIRIADIAKAPGKTAYGPYQAYLAKGWYPYKRTVHVINAQARKGLGLGFASYLAGDGQRIILKDCLLMPLRV
jgi:phosphate transport system substrate-binding protein